MASRLAVFTIAALALATTIATAAASQTARPQTPPARDARPVAQTGTAVIRGRVVAANGGRPLRRVQLRFTAPELTAGPPRTTSTDEDGRYEMTDLPAGHYTVFATRGGFLSLRYGQRRPREQGKLVDLADRQAVENVDFALPKMSLISGRITDEEGEPIAGVRVLAMRSIYFAGRRQLVNTSAANVLTDDVGEYRIGELVPGTYVVSARSADKWTVGPAGREESMGYAPTYFPGTADLKEAQRVTIGIAQQASAIDFSLVPARTVTVSGTAFDSHGRPISNVGLVQETGGPNGGIVGMAGTSAPAVDGRFVIRTGRATCAPLVPPTRGSTRSRGCRPATTWPSRSTTCRTGCGTIRNIWRRFGGTLRSWS